MGSDKLGAAYNTYGGIGGKGPVNFGGLKMRAGYSWQFGHTSNLKSWH